MSEKCGSNCLVCITKTVKTEENEGQDQTPADVKVSNHYHCFKCKESSPFMTDDEKDCVKSCPDE